MQQCTFLAKLLEYSQAMDRVESTALKFGPLMLDLCASGVGCFVLRAGYRLVATTKERSSMELSGSSEDPIFDPLKEICA